MLVEHCVELSRGLAAATQRIMQDRAIPVRAWIGGVECDDPRDRFLRGSERADPIRSRRVGQARVGIIGMTEHE